MQNSTTGRYLSSWTKAKSKKWWWRCSTEAV